MPLYQGTTTIELGNGSDTTLSRNAAGVLAVEGVVVPTLSSTSTLTNKTLSSPTVSGTVTGVFVLGANASSSYAPTHGGSIRITDTNPLTIGGGIEWLNSVFSSGFGWRTATPDEGGGSAPWIMGTRSNSATWTEGFRLANVNGVLAAWLGKSVAIPAGGTAGFGFLATSTANFGVFFGSGTPTLSAAKGSLYMRSDGSGINDRMYVNTDGSTTWTAVVTVA